MPIKIAVCGALPEAGPQEAVDRLRELQPPVESRPSGQSAAHRQRMDRSSQSAAMP